MTKLNLTLVVVAMIVASCAFAQSNIQPAADDDQQPAAQVAPATTPAATPAATPAPPQNGRDGKDGRDGAPGRTIFVRRSMSVSQLQIVADQGGPASAWANAAVADALKRGRERGGVVGRKPGAKPSDKEWRKKDVSRQELAVAVGGASDYAERLLKAHEDPKSGSHPDIRKDAEEQAGKITGLQKQLGWIKLGLLLLALYATGAYFFPRLRMPRPGGYYN